MHCPNCGAVVGDSDRFCGNCGGSLPVAAQQPPQTPTQPVPPRSDSGQQQPPTSPPVPGKTRSAGLIIGLSLIAVLMVAGLGVGGFLAWRALQPDDESQTATAEPSGKVGTDVTGAPREEPAPVGAATPGEAVEAELPDGWVYDVLVDDGATMEFVAGPPNSEFIEVLVVEQAADGSWVFVESYAYDIGALGQSGPDSGALSPEDEATQVVGEFIYAVKQDRADDAHALTIAPFSDDPASAQFSNGDLRSFEVLGASLQSDGATVWVRSRETWVWGTEEWIYVCVPTEAGYRIRDLRAP